MAPNSNVFDNGRRLYDTTHNTITGLNFNTRAHYEATRESDQRFDHEDVEIDGSFDAEEEWTRITKVPRNQNHNVDEPLPTFHVQETPLSDRALSAACYAAGTTAEYLGSATKPVAVEAARHLGRVAKTQTATAVARDVKRTFPVLGYLRRAYLEGKGNRDRLREEEYDGEIEEGLEDWEGEPAAERDGPKVETIPEVRFPNHGEDENRRGRTRSRVTERIIKQRESDDEDEEKETESSALVRERFR